MQDILDPKYLATLSDEQFDALLNSVAQPQKPKPKPYVEPTPPRDMGFMEGNLKKAWGGFGAMAGGAIGLVGDLVGSDAIKDYGLGAAEGAQMYNRDIDQRMITPETNLIDTYEKQGLLEAAKATPQFIAEQAVQNLPMMIGTGGVGGFVGKSATKSMLLKELSKKGLAAEALKEGVEATARKHLGDDVLTAIANKGGLAATGASGAQWSGLESGSIYADQPIDQKDPLKALAFGTMAGMIEPLPEAAAIMRSGLGKKLLTGVGKEGAETYKQAFKNVGVDLLKQAPMEGAQEMVQTGLEQAGAHKDPFTEESFKEQVVGGIAGMGIGGAFGGTTSAYQQFPLKKQIIDQKTPVDLTGKAEELKDEATVEANASVESETSEIVEKIVGKKPSKNIFASRTVGDELTVGNSNIVDDALINPPQVASKGILSPDLDSVNIENEPVGRFSDEPMFDPETGEQLTAPAGFSFKQPAKPSSFLDEDIPEFSAYEKYMPVVEEEQDAPINVYYGTGENAHFSNLAHRPFEIGGKKYVSVEHAYQSNKSGAFDQETYDKYKKAGVKIAGNKGTDTKTNMDTMVKAMYQSFKQNPEAARKLIETGEAEFSHKQDKTIWKEAFPKMLKDVRDALVYEQQYNDQPIYEEQEEDSFEGDYGDDVAPQSKMDRVISEGRYNSIPVRVVDAANTKGMVTAFRIAFEGDKKKPVLEIDPEKTRLAYEKKKWAVSRELADGTKAKPLSENLFPTFDDFFDFWMFHEFSHINNPKRSDETNGAYEDRVNEKALKEYFKTRPFVDPYKAPEQPKQSRKLEMQPDNIAKIKSGAKTATTRTYPIKAGEYSLPNGTKVIVEEDTKPIWFKDLEDPETYAKEEGFESIADMRKNAKFPTTKQFLDGKIQLHVAKFKLDETPIAESKAKRNIAVIGTAGRDKTRQYTLDMWKNMVSDSKSHVSKSDNLVSGGAAWADHLAVRLFLEVDVSGLTLHLPAPIKNGKFVGGYKTAGGTAQYYHDQFKKNTGINGVAEIEEAIKRGAKATYQPEGSPVSAMFTRNKLVAKESDAALAYTFGEDDVEDGGTKNTWDQISSKDKKHRSIHKLGITETKPSTAPKTIFPKKDTVSPDLVVEMGSDSVQSIVLPTAGSKNVFASPAQTGGETKSRFQNEPHKINYYKKIFKTAEIPYDDKNKEAVAIESGYDSFQDMFEDEGTPANDALKRVKFSLKAKLVSERLGTRTSTEDVERFLDKNDLLTDDAKKAIAERELKSIKHTGKEEDPESKEYQQFQRKVHSPNFTTSKPSYDRDNPTLRGVHKQKYFSEEKEGLIKELTTNEKELAKRLGLRVRRDKATDMKGLKAIISRKITADNNKAFLKAKNDLDENKLLSQEEKQEILDYISISKEEDIFIPDLIEELNRVGEVYSFVYLDAVPDMIANTDPDDLDNSWGKKGGQQKIEDNLDGTFSRNEDYVGEENSGKLKVKPTHKYKFDNVTRRVRKNKELVYVKKQGIRSKSLEGRLQNEKEQQAAAYKVFVDYKVEERQNDIENVYDVIKAIKEIADSGLRSVDSILRAQDVLKKRPMLRGKDQKAKLESVQRIMSGNRLIISGEWVPVYNTSNEWIGLDKIGNEEHTYSIETEDGKVKEYTGAIPTEYNVSENVFDISREIVSTSFDPSYAAPLDEADPHEMKRDGIQTIDSGSKKISGITVKEIELPDGTKKKVKKFAPRDAQTAKSYVTKAAIDKMLELGISRGFATEKHREIIEKHNAKIVALQEERDSERQKHGVLNEEGQLRIPKTGTEDKEKYYLEEIATENRKMVAVLLPIKATMLKAQLKSVFFEDKNFFEKESDRYVSQGFTKEFLHALAKESQYDYTIYQSKINREIQRKNQELVDKIFMEVKDSDKDVSAINSYLFSAGNFTQQERENFAKYDDSIAVENIIEETDEGDSSVKTKTKSKTLVRFIDTLTTQEREKLEIFKVLQQRLLDVAKGPEKKEEVPFDKKASDKKFLDNEALAGYFATAEANNESMIFTGKEESEKSLLEKSVEQFFATRHPDEKVSLGKLRDQSQQTFFEKFAKTFGAELVVIRDYREKHKQFQGKYFVSKSGKPVIIVNANGTSFGRVFAHELFHHIVNKANPKEYQAFKDAVLTNVPENKFDEAIEKARTIWAPLMTKAQAIRVVTTSEFNTTPRRVMSSDNESTARRPEKLEKLVSTIRTKLDNTSSVWSTSTYETGIQSVFPEGLKQELEEEIFAEMFSFAFNTKDFWENMSNTPAGASLSQKLIKGFIDILNKVLDFFNKNIKQLNNGIFGIKGLVAHDNWFDDIITGEAPPEGKTFTDVYGKMPVSGVFSLMYDLMGAALDSDTLNNTSFKAEQIDNSKMLPTIEEVKNHIANHATYKKIFPNGINSYKDVMTAVENLLSNLKTWIVKNMPAGVFTHVGASEPVKKIMFSVAHGGMLEAQKAFGEAVEPHAKVFDKMTSLELEAFVDDVTKNGLKNVTSEQREALLAMKKVSDQTFAKLQMYFPYLQQRENHFGLSIKWLNKDKTLFEDEFEWEAYGSKLEGNKRFMKEKSDLSIAEIREKYNLDYETIHPQKLFLRYIKDAHYLMNFQEQMKDARKEDIARYFTDQKEAMEAGYVPVNDNALKVFQRMGFSDGYKIKLSDGTYYSQNETPVYFSSEYEANKVAEAISGAYESVEVEKFTPDKLVKVAYFDIYTEVDGKELFVSSSKTQKEAERIANKNPDYFIKERIASQQDSVIAQMYFKPDMAKMMNSLLSQDGFKSFKAFGVSGAQAMDLKNIATSMELSFSMFHAFTIGQESISSYAAWQQGLKKMGIGSGVGINSYNPTKVVTESKKIVTLMKDALKQGNTKEILARAEALLGIKNPDVLDIMTQYYKAGGQLGQDSDLRGSGADVGHVDYSSLGSFFNSFKETYNKEVKEFKQKNPDSKIKFGASISWDMFKYTAHASSAWLMEEGIPKMKMAQFAREYSLKLEQYKEEIAAGLKTKEQIAIDTILFIEDRFGEVSWKNKWLDATYKTSLQFAFRSFTWIAGTYVALGKTMPEYAKLGWFKLKGEEYHLTEKGLWGIHVLGAHIFTAALLSSVYTLGAALSGDEQETDKDTPWLTRMLFPRVDPYDNTRRLSVPSYVTEFYKIASHLGYGGNPVEATKLISGRFNSLLSKSVEIAKNEDFRGTLIRNPKDSIVGQTADVVQHIIPLPISWGTIIKDAQKEGFKPQSVMTGLMGFTDAPASAKRSVAANTAYKIGRKEYKGKETTGYKMELIDELSRAVSAYKSGDKSKVEKLLAEGRISTRQFQIALERTPVINGRPNPVYKDQLKQQVTRLTIDGSLDVWEKMSANEKNKHRADIIKKYSNMLSRQDKPIEEKKKITARMKELGIIK